MGQCNCRHRGNVVDAGHPSHETLQELTSAGIEFLVRLPRAGTFKLVEAFVRSGAADKIVTIDPPQEAGNGVKLLARVNAR